MPSRTHAIIATLLAWRFAADIPASAMRARASERIDPATYPELAPEVQLLAIPTELRHTLPDIYSVREMRLCPASRIKLKNGKPVEWTTRFEYNAEDQNGGYTGIQRDVAIFKNGRIAYPIGNTPQLGRTGLEGILSKTVDKQMVARAAMPDATIQQMLADAR